ncbi:TPA: DUF2586 family protein [Yersinia enterocolitica]|uniref:DUF2586 domain-containing protein n=1 Tax=Yersinia TaxID=629 RepID=UPI0005E92622|nr:MULTISPECIES: DUF2586 domain-containing protein [Yersinia]EKN3942744.1 DUF2586 family protein [Yersinia enterocolitica]CNJ74999.1 putative tail sheath protein [Yersinia enterocolitica]HDL6527642.1 DUF2586 family protein [Yersinia enterocolitica]HDL6731029.1 DUF2586 family protein [Yersinia enterocolitica]HDL6746939.1 DUF2586 family protein [Yersinia enterocolitica]
MTWPTVTIDQLNQRQGKINEVERTVLFIGSAADDSEIPGDLIALDSQSDITVVLADTDTALRENVRAAQRNGGQNWQAYALLLAADAEAGDDMLAILSAQQMISVEGVICTIPITTVADGRTKINLYAALRAELTNKYGRWVWSMLTVSGPAALPVPVSWSAYQAFLAELETGIAAESVQLVPALWGNEAGVLAGRLCHRSVTVADSPARVKTGALIGLGIDTAEMPVDSNGVEVTLAHLRAMHDLRYSVPMWYPDYEGMYWSDGRTLDVVGGDYQIIENLRIVDKVARRVRIQAISKIADRSMNSTPASIAAHQTFFARTMRDMSHSSQINGVMFPGEVKSPQSGDVVITWSDNETVSIYLVVRPYGSAKTIQIGIMLDQSITAVSEN